MNKILCISVMAFIIAFFNMTIAKDSCSAGVADPNTYLASIKTEMSKKWPGNHTINIVCHGHSVPAGYFRTPVVDTFNAYPHVLHKAIKDAYPYAVVNVIVTAIGGETSKSGAERFEKDVLVHKPDVLLIDYGLNDRGIGLENANTAWTNMIEKAKAQDVKVILLTPTADQGAALEDSDDPLNQHAEQIRRLAGRFNVALVDSLAEFKAYVKKGGKLEELMSQGNHPNRKGHDLVVSAAIKWFSSQPAK
jgi:lysophospholipase L1-like esterase